MPIYTDKVTYGQSNTPSENHHIDGSTPNVLSIKRGTPLAPGAEVFRSDAGVVSFPNQVHSCIRLNTANGYGSTNTRYRRFTNTVLSQGTDVTYTDSATLGSSFTINANGVYSISYTDQFTASDVTQLSLNDTAPTGSLITTEGLANSSSGTANTNQCASWTGYLVSGSVIRARSQNGAATGSALAAQFTITRVA